MFTDDANIAESVIETKFCTRLVYTILVFLFLEPSSSKPSPLYGEKTMRLFKEKLT